MPPDQDLFPGKEDAAGGEGKAGAPAAAAIDEKALEGVLARTLGPAFQQIRAEIASVRDEAKAAKGGDAPAGGKAGAGGLDKDSYEELLADPTAFVEKVANGQFGKVAGPALVQALEAIRESNIEREERAIDETFGEGYFAKEIRPRLDAAFEKAKVPIQRQADKDVLAATVSAIIGMEFRDPAKGKELEKRRTEVEKKRTAPPMLGPGRSRPTGKAIDPEETERIQKIVRSGYDYSEGEYLKDRETPGTASAWKARFAAEAKASAKA